MISSISSSRRRPGRDPSFRGLLQTSDSEAYLWRELLGRPFSGCFRSSAFGVILWAPESLSRSVPFSGLIAGELRRMSVRCARDPSGLLQHSIGAVAR